MPHSNSSLSYIYQVTGCQHSLQPTDDDFAPPSVPALTFRGFSRWESLEILLEPDEHYAFLQVAVRDWALKHPDTGQPFPLDLPRAVFPAHTDAAVDRWHRACAERLAKEAEEQQDDESTKSHRHVHGQPYPERVPLFTHVPPRDMPGRPQRNGGTYSARPFSYVHIPGRPETWSRRSPDRSHGRSCSAERERMRRRSFSDYHSPPPPDVGHKFVSPVYDDTRRPNGRKHVPGESSDEELAEPRAKHRDVSPPPSRFVPPGAAQSPFSPAYGRASPPPRSRRNAGRPDEVKRRSMLSPLGSLRDTLNETVSSFLPGGKWSERPRGATQNSSADTMRSRKSRERMQPKRAGRGSSDVESEESPERETSEDELRRRRRMREVRDRGRPGERAGRAREMDREWEDGRDPAGARRDTLYGRRQPAPRRTSSHADVDRRRSGPWWDAREMERGSVRDGKRRDRHPSAETPPVTGAGGRRHAEPA